MLIKGMMYCLGEKGRLSGIKSTAPFYRLAACGCSGNFYKPIDLVNMSVFVTFSI